MEWIVVSNLPLRMHVCVVGGKGVKTSYCFLKRDTQRERGIDVEAERGS